MTMFYSKTSGFFCTLLINALALRWENTGRWEHGGKVYGNEGNDFFKEDSDNKKRNDSRRLGELRGLLEIIKSRLLNIILLCLDKTEFCSCERGSTCGDTFFDKCNFFSTAKDELYATIVEFLRGEKNWTYIKREENWSNKELNCSMKSAFEPICIWGRWGQYPVSLCIVDVFLNFFFRVCKFWSGSQDFRRGLHMPV